MSRDLVRRVGSEVSNSRYCTLLHASIVILISSAATDRLGVAAIPPVFEGLIMESACHTKGEAV